MTYHAYRADRITSLSPRAYSAGYDLHNFTGDQTKLLLYSNIVSEAPKTVIGKQIAVELDQRDIEFVTTQLLTMPFWRDRMRVMVEAADEVASWDRAPQSGARPGHFDLDRNIKKHLDILDYGHEVCRTPHCQHKSHPERAPANNN